jgi:MFS family permease
MVFYPVDSLKSRTFIGLLVAQFLAAFNDQAIHASAMFFAINHKTLTEANAISLMPILFYAPWAMFCTLSGWLADRYSKRQSLVFWKVAEIGITSIALLGFWLGTAYPHSNVGPWIVLSTVFLMGTHSAFFVPAKYGVMPEILPPHLLSKGNGMLESLSFLAVILGTVSGGVMSFLFHRSDWFQNEEYYIGIVLVTLALIGAAASFLIEKMPAANPTRPFPRNLFKPLFNNLRVLLRSKPLALAVLGIAFFTFMVAFMRGAVYMHGETRNPRWTELHTSVVVGVVALGVGLGSPLAGFLSGGKIELGLVPLGACGMILSLLLAALTLNSEVALIGCLIGIGFFTGFYIVPLFTLLQHRAPPACKGDLLASSNFINVTGAIAASLLFKFLVLGAQWTGLTPAVPIEESAKGVLEQLRYRHGRPAHVQVIDPSGREFDAFSSTSVKAGEDERVNRTIIELEENPKVGQEVVVGHFQLLREGRDVDYYRIQPADLPLTAAYDKEPLTCYLFLTAGLMTLGTLILLCRQLPDFFVRSLLWLRARGKRKLHVVGLHHIPTDGPVILATNCESLGDCLHVVAATDRFTRFLFPDAERDGTEGALLRYLVRRSGLIPLPADTSSAAWTRAVAKGGRALKNGSMIGVTVDGQDTPPEMATILQRLRAAAPAAVVPVFCAEGAGPAVSDIRGVRVVIGPPVKEHASVADLQEAIRSLTNVTVDAEEPVAAGAMH